MRDFLNEDELSLLRSNCISGLLDLTEEALSVPKAQAFKFGSYEAFQECAHSKSISEIEEIAAASKRKEDLYSISNFDGRLDDKIDFQRAKYLQTRFILGCLLALRHVKDTIETEEASFLTPEHFAFVDLWRESEEVVESNII